MISSENFFTNFFNELRRRNPVLYWYGILNIIAAIICIIFWQQTNIQVNGINAFIKPLKFYLSIFIFVWTMGWYMFYLEMPARVRAYNWMTVIVASYESFVITWQAANGRLSHFNITSHLYTNLFTLMGVAITLLTVWTGYICYLFFRRKEWLLPMSYVWGIRLGLLFFVIFAFEGGVMASILKHTVGGSDNGSGIMMLNWSRQHGDLRIAHFLGIHSLQVLPLFGYYVTGSNKTLLIFSLAYLILIVSVLIGALMGLPLI